ncbi:MAG: hypothetical protein ACW97X_14455 [Candidatus Hodarchaeales archaeon]|jgi:hypothetical protein
MNKPIPRGLAIQICEEILIEHKKSRLWPLGIGKLQCWGCQRFGKKNDSNENICALNNDDNRGCWQVNKRFDQNFTGQTE